jgi:hemoglobin
VARIDRLASILVLSSPRELALIGVVPEETLYTRIGGQAGLSRLVKWFYAKVRYEPEVAGIFKSHVHNWPEHIRLIIEFWSLMTGGPSSYGGGMGKHIFLHLKPEHYAVWLAVWEQNCLELLPYKEAMEMIQLAHNIGDDLRRMGSRATAAGN